MGIRNLMKLVYKYAPSSITYHKIDHYKSKRIGIDTNLLLYKLLFAIRMKGYDIKNNNLNVTHIHALILKILGFIKYDIAPIFVFDGSFPIIKQETLDIRKQFKQTMKNKYIQANKQNDTENIKKYYFMKSDITQQEIDDCIELLHIFGYQTIISKSEADAQLAELIKQQMIDYIVTDDLDILVFGGSNILKNFTISNKKYIQEINLSVLLKQFNMTMSQFIDLAIMLGCDYCPSIKGIGTIKAFDLIKKYNNIETILSNTDIVIPCDFKSVRQYFVNPPVNKINDKFGVVDKLKLSDFLIKFQFSDKYITKVLNSV